MLLISRNSGARELAEPSRAMEANVNLTSSAVTSRAVVEVDALAQMELPVRPPSGTSQRSGQHGNELALGVPIQQVLLQGLEDDVLGPDVEVG